VAELEGILADASKVLHISKEEMGEIRRRYSDPAAPRSKCHPARWISKR
jgi:hypothetical protein